MAQSGRVSFQAGIDEYLAGRHYEAHEAWEELWQEEANEDRRRFLQALIQVASAVHKATHNVAPRGSVRLLDAAAEKLDGLGDTYLGVDLAGLRSTATACRVEIERQLANSGGCNLTQEFIPRVVLLSDAPLFHKPKSEPAVSASARHAWFDEGLSTYAAGAYFEAHELWEELWRDAPHGFDRQFMQGLIQVAAAMHKLFEHGKPKPAARLLTRALEKLADSPPRYRGLDVSRLLREGHAAIATLQARGTLDATQIPRIAKLPKLTRPDEQAR